MKHMVENIFSVKNQYINSQKYKIVRILGAKMKFKTSKNCSSQQVEQYNITTIDYVISMLKAYNIRYIVSAPGAQNAYFNYIVQNDSFFKVFSVVDERSAAYVALGIAEEKLEPVVVTCTGATASRNFLSAFTEAYYRKIPIIALTFFNYANNRFNLSAQFVDRSITQNDIKELSVELPKIYDDVDRKRCIAYCNAVLTTLHIKHKPVHINCPSTHNYHQLQNKITTKYTHPMQDIWTTSIYNKDNIDNIDFSAYKGKNICVVIGSHPKFDTKTLQTISEFASNCSVPIFCDHTSNYNGKNKILVAQTWLVGLDVKPDLIIDIGDVAEYSALHIYTDDVEVWRVASDGEFKCRYDKPVTKTFVCSEFDFFNFLKSKFNNHKYYNTIKPTFDGIAYPDLPLSMPYICKCISQYIPKNSFLEVAILNAIRNMNYFSLDESVDISSNVGGFGIDGAVSTLVGHSMVSDRKCFGIIGDLAFFYDMNIVGNRHIGNNLRIILVNNSMGVEFRLNPILETSFNENTNKFVAAANHNKGGAKGWAESCGFDYICATTKEEFDEKIVSFCSDNSDKPILFEVFTKDIDEKDGLRITIDYNKQK